MMSFVIVQLYFYINNEQIPIYSITSTKVVAYARMLDKCFASTFTKGYEGLVTWNGNKIWDLKYHKYSSF